MRDGVNPNRSSFRPDEHNGDINYFFDLEAKDIEINSVLFESFRGKVTVATNMVNFCGEFFSICGASYSAGSGRFCEAGVPARTRRSFSNSYLWFSILSCSNRIPLSGALIHLSTSHPRSPTLLCPRAEKQGTRNHTTRGWLTSTTTSRTSGSDSMPTRFLASNLVGQAYTS